MRSAVCCWSPNRTLLASSERSLPHLKRKRRPRSHRPGSDTLIREAALGPAQLPQHLGTEAFPVGRRDLPAEAHQLRGAVTAATDRPLEGLVGVLLIPHLGEHRPRPLLLVVEPAREAISLRQLALGSSGLRRVGHVLGEGSNRCGADRAAGPTAAPRLSG
jgi:hypothetical protein